MAGTTRIRSTASTNDGITWYYEQEGSGPDIVLIPDGLGEAEFFNKGMPLIAEHGFRVTTFDMPGMGRSSKAPIEAYTEVTAQRLAKYVINLLDHLKIDKAAFWGCSSAGSTVLVLCKDYPARVRNALVHEAPTTLEPHLMRIASLPDEEIVKTMDTMNRSMQRNFDEQYTALGAEAHARLAKNYVTWARGYPHIIPLSTPMDALDKIAEKPVFWTVGWQTPMGLFYENVVGATKAGIEMKVLPGGHLVYISHPEEFARHVVEQSKKYV